jgi:cytidyltransferase-like protein
MNNIDDLNNFLNEKRVTVKRRYTEAHPAKNVSTAARVRSTILDSVADGHITEEEMTRILSELKAHKRWLSRNKGLFNISEDQAGIKTFSLSPYGLRVKNKTTILNEALNVPHKEKGKKPVNMFVGRFQPFTLGHVKVFEKMYKENGLPVVVYMVRGGKPDPEKRPFDEDMQQAMFAKMKKQYPFLEASFVVPNGAIDTMFAAARPAYEPMMWGYGTDRKKAYGNMINKQSYRDDLGVDPSFKGYEIPRTGENISASKVRNALKIDDERTFKKMTPKSIHGFYKPLQTIMQPIKENDNMKNLKSLTDFSSVNEAKFKEGQYIKSKVDSDNFIADVYDRTNEIDGSPIEKGASFEIRKIKGGETILWSDADEVEYSIETDDLKNFVKESVVNEEYIELMPELEEALGRMAQDWEQWKNGPLTEPKDIKPAAKELTSYVMNWLKKNIK